MKNLLITSLKALFQIWLVLASVVTISSFIGISQAPTVSTILEFVKVVLGPFLGAGLAFFANDFIYQRNRRADEKAKAFGAAFAIRAMYDDFVIYRHVIRVESDNLYRSYSKIPNDTAPIWAYAKPAIFTFRTAGFPDLVTLQFLLDYEEGRTAFEQLQKLERAYKDLANAHVLQMNAANALQTKLETIPTRASGTFKSDGEAVGPKLTADARDLYMALIRRLDGDEKLYIAASASFSIAVDTHFRKHVGLKPLEIAASSLREENLPPLPKVVADTLHSQKAPSVVQVAAE